MGFMDKAKQMAEQAQQKIDEAQKQFNDSQAQRSQQPQGGAGVRYDSNGRPIQEEAPAAAQTPPAPVAAEPVEPAATGAPPAEEAAAPQPPASEPAAAQPPAPEPAPTPTSDGVNSTPDPFKPIE